MTAKDLKNAILQEAIQGKLVPQNKTEGSGNDLLKQIKAQKEEMLKQVQHDGSVSFSRRRESTLPPITDEEKPFELPENWCWCRLGELGLYRKGPFGSSLTKSMFVPKSDTSIKVYEQKNAIQKNYAIGDYFISQEKFKTMQSFIVEPGDIIVSCAGTIGEVYQLPEKASIGIINQALMRVKLWLPELCNFWMIYFDYVLKQESSKKSSGTAIKNIPPFEILKSFPFPLPPLEEQKRIVAAIEQLLPLVNEYGKANQELDLINKNIAGLTKKAILQEAIQGKLVPQNKTEGSGGDLLKQIKKQKEEMLKQVQHDGSVSFSRRRESTLPPITDEEKPFELPENWCWCRLGEVVYKLTDGAHRTPHYTDSGIPFLSVKDLSSGIINFDNTKFISTEEHKELFKRCNPGKNDILLTKVGTTGIPVLVNTDKEFSLFVSVALLKFDTKLLEKKFLLYLLQSPLVQDQAKENTKGVGNKNWVIEAISNTILPLPPLSEQKRIVAAIEQLLPLAERLGKIE